MTDRKLDAEELGHLRKAGAWGLLRDLGGAKVCLTGKMAMERSNMAELIQAAGGVFTNAMSQGVALLVVADDGIWTSKMQKADDQGTRVVRESAFVAALLPSPEELLSGSRHRVPLELLGFKPS